MKLRPPPVDVGTLTVSGMTFGILFGWGVLYLTRDETRAGLADLNQRLTTLERAPEMEAHREKEHRLKLARAAYMRNAPTSTDVRLLYEAGELEKDEAARLREMGILVDEPQEDQ